ncbi:MAG: hypothetical protein IKU13_06065, partial [Clostridia bacterium]|nr:hypothetical protein [Clostridia bacterium]
IGIPLAFALPFIFDVSQLYKHVGKVTIIYIIFLFATAVFLYNSYTLSRIVTYSAFLMPVLYTVLMCRMRGKGYLGFLAACGALMLMTMAQISMTSGIAFTLTNFAVCIIISLYAIFKGWFGGKIRPLGFVALYGILATLYLTHSHNTSYFVNRLQRVFAPLSDPQGYGWTATRARDFLSRAVFIGQGNGETAYNNIAGYHTDYALTNLIHSFGWIILVILGMLTAVFLLKIFLTARKQTSQLAKSVSYAVLLIFALNTALYFAVNMGIIGSISTCPAFLFGGKMSMAVSAFLLGVVTSTNRNGGLITDKAVPKSYFKMEKTGNKIIITIGE